MKFRITGQVSDGVAGEYPNDFIRFVKVDHIVEASDEFEALDKVPRSDSDFYICRDLEIQPVLPTAA